MGQVIKRFGDQMTDIKREGEEQRDILRALCRCVGELKTLIDQLAKRV